MKATDLKSSWDEMKSEINHPFKKGKKLNEVNTKQLKVTNWLLLAVLVAGIYFYNY